MAVTVAAGWLTCGQWPVASITRISLSTRCWCIQAPTTIDLPNGEQVTLEPLIREGRRLGLKHFDPCTILLNNDLSAGPPAILQGIEQPIAPALIPVGAPS